MWEELAKERKIELLVSLGGREWKGGDHHRVYINDPYELACWDVNRYASGNVSSAAFKGERVSNNKANQAWGKIVYHVNEDRFEVPSNHLMAETLGWIKEQAGEFHYYDPEREIAGERVSDDVVVSNVQIEGKAPLPERWVACKGKQDISLMDTWAFELENNREGDMARAFLANLRPGTYDWGLIQGFLKFFQSSGYELNVSWGQIRERLYDTMAENIGLNRIRYDLSCITGTKPKIPKISLREFAEEYAEKEISWDDTDYYNKEVLTMRLKAASLTLAAKVAEVGHCGAGHFDHFKTCSTCASKSQVSEPCFRCGEKLEGYWYFTSPVKVEGSRWKPICESCHQKEEHRKEMGILPARIFGI